MSVDPLLIPYGGRRWPVERLDPARPDPDLGPFVAIDPTAGPLRFSSFPYVFAEPPEYGSLTEREARLDFLREHFKSYWGLWDKPALAFLDAYFRHIAATIETCHDAIVELAVPHGGLFEPADWSFSALAPIPIAHLRAGADWIYVDFAFWTGERLVALDIVGSDERARRPGRERLRTAGHDVSEFPGAALRRADSAAALRELLPTELSEFWRGVALPASPFRIGSLDMMPKEQSK